MNDYETLQSQFNRLSGLYYECQKERDAALEDLERLDNALNVTNTAATKWLSELTKARQLLRLILDDPRLVVAMSSDLLVPIKSLLARQSDPFESKLNAPQQRLTAADDRADVLEGLLREIRQSCELSRLRDAQIDAALKPAEGQLNQCDGCQAGIPLINGTHRMGEPNGYANKIKCTADLYK